MTISGIKATAIRILIRVARPDFFGGGGLPFLDFDEAMAYPRVRKNHYYSTDPGHSIPSALIALIAGSADFQFQIPDSRFQIHPGVHPATWNLEIGIWNLKSGI